MTPFTEIRARVHPSIGAGAAFTVAAVSGVGVLVWSGQWFAFVGIPIATALGALLAPRIEVDGPFPYPAVVKMCFWSVVLGDIAVAGRVGGDGSAAVAAVLGFLIFGLPAFIILMFPSIAWAVLARAVAARVPGSTRS